MPGKRIQFDGERWTRSICSRRPHEGQELADEAFRDLLQKHGRPIDLKDALRKSVRAETSAAPRNERYRKWGTQDGIEKGRS